MLHTIKVERRSVLLLEGSLRLQQNGESHRNQVRNIDFVRFDVFDTIVSTELENLSKYAVY